ncbi:hypothetical protein IRJ41_002677 [Triplophysa rosa]|uniref:Uncharacterized protein n=1 Tax=Triplophysa rosa TaxID=992332 RepID=A0A9W7TEY0_TRIRA|nr:hypothetical protein IRJ41_002677 [Triplophysa rosa]
MEHQNNNSIRHPAVTKDPCTVFWESGSFLSALHSSRVHVVTQTGVKGRPASERSKPAAAVATDKDESNNIRLSYKGTAGHIPKELLFYVNGLDWCLRFFRRHLKLRRLLQHYIWKIFTRFTISLWNTLIFNHSSVGRGRLGATISYQASQYHIDC